MFISIMYYKKSFIINSKDFEREVCIGFLLQQKRFFEFGKEIAEKDLWMNNLKIHVWH